MSATTAAPVITDDTAILWYAHIGKTTRSQVCASGILPAATVREMQAKGNVLTTYVAETEAPVKL